MKPFDKGSIVVISITLVLFSLALFSTGFTHDLLLVTGVFLVSVKLIMMSYKISLVAENMESDLKEIKTLLAERSQEITGLIIEKTEHN